MFELKQGKVLFDSKVSNPKPGGHSFAVKVGGDRLAKLQAILAGSGWKNLTKTSNEETRWWAERQALLGMTEQLLDSAIEQHSAK